MNKILDYLKTCDDGFIDDEQVAYSKGLPFTWNEFVDFHGALEKSYADDFSEDNTNIFPERRMYFNYKGLKFIWRILHGQGTGYQLWRADANTPEDWNMVFKDEKSVTNFDKMIMSEALE